MANKPIKMLQIRRILQLLENGQSKRHIARMLGSGRHTVDAYVSRIEKTGIKIAVLKKLTDAELAALLYPNHPEPFPDERYEDLQTRLDYFQKELTRTGVTKLRLWQEYRQQVLRGYGYSQFCEHIGMHARLSAATMHFEHRPGERVQADFAGEKLSYVDTSTGETISCPVLVCVLPYSGYAYIEALHSTVQEHLFAALGRCMSYFGGVPQNVLSDNMKQFVHKSNRYEPLFSEISQQWALHYDTTLSATRVAKPKDKPTVENMVRITYLRVYAPLRDQEFHSLAALNQGILACLDVHNHTPFQKRSYSRMERFIQEELPVLKILPPEPFIIKHQTFSKVQKNYHVILGEDWHFYSVPCQLIGKQVKIIYDTEEVEIYLGLQRILVYERDYNKNGYTTLAEHMPEKHRKYLETRGWDADYFLQKAGEMGECSREIMNRILQTRAFPEQAYNACLGLLRLSDRYGRDRFENACKRAISAPRVSFRLIDNILTNNLDKESEQPGSLFAPIPDHENIRGPQAYQ